MQVGKTDHQLRIEAFYRGTGAAFPAAPAMLGEKEREGRARKVLEEALELVEALGFDLRIGDESVSMGAVEFVSHGHVVIEDVVKECCDVSVVTIGTLSALGVKDEPVLRLVDENNMAKLAGGHRDEHGKWVKPKGHPKPDIAAELVRQGWKG